MGLIKAALGAASGVMGDQWKEYFYCDALPAEVLAVKGQKRTNGRSANRHGSENVISDGSVIAVADGQCVLTNLERATETKMGDQVITTGLGGVFPPDLLVGTVQKVEPEVSGKSSIAVVRPGADPRTAKHVFIVTAY